MAALDFPSNPNTSSEVTTGDITWKWNGYAWYSTTDGAPGGGTISVGESPPNPADEGDLWWNSSEDSGRLFVYTGSEWVDASPQGDSTGVSEAPTDGQQYARQDGDWTVVQGGGGGGTTINYNGASAWGLCDPSNSNNVIGGLNVKDAVQISTGYYEITFTTPMPNANYSVSLTPNTVTGPNERIGRVSERSADKFRVAFVDKAGSSAPTAFSFAVHATNAQPPRGGTGADAWACTGADGVLFNGFNLTASKISTGKYQYTFVTPVGTDSYSVQATAVASGSRFGTVFNLTTTGFQVNFQNTAFGEQDVTHMVTVFASNATLPAPLTQDMLLFVDGRNASTGIQRFNVIKAQTSDSTLTSASNNSIVDVAISSEASFTDVIGVRTNIRSSNASGSAYSFYAAGNAPSYFAGNTYVGVDSTNYPGEDTLSGAIHSTASTAASNNPAGAAIRVKATTNSNPHILSVWKNTDTTQPTGGGLAMNGSTGDLSIVNPSDYRLKSDIVDLVGATETIKALKPKEYTFRDVPNCVGFVAHELQEVIPEAVFGEKDGIIPIGTYTNPDGAVETEVTEPEAIPFGATWVPTGTRDVYQGVDQSKLIPLLTKALQEALERIEALEAAAGI